MGASYAEKEQRTRNYLERRKADLNAQLDRWVTLIEFAQEALRSEMTKAHAASGKSLSAEDARKLRELGSAMEAAARTKISMAKAEKLLGSQLTPEQVLQGSVKKIMSLKPGTRAVVLLRMFKRHVAEGGVFGNHVHGTTDSALSSLATAVRNQSDPEPQAEAEADNLFDFSDVEQDDAALDDSPGDS